MQNSFSGYNNVPYEHYSQYQVWRRSKDRIKGILGAALKTVEDIPQCSNPESALDIVYSLYDRTVPTSRDVKVLLNGGENDNMLLGMAAKLFKDDQRHARELLSILNTDSLNSRAEFMETCFNRMLVKDVLFE